LGNWFLEQAVRGFDTDSFSPPLIAGTVPCRRAQKGTNRRGKQARIEAVCFLVFLYLHATPGLLALIMVSKYCDRLPLYRQEPIYCPTAYWS
jgi:hypothetical protein